MWSTEKTLLSDNDRFHGKIWKMNQPILFLTRRVKLTNWLTWYLHWDASQTPEACPLKEELEWLQRTAPTHDTWGSCSRCRNRSHRKTCVPQTKPARKQPVYQMYLYYSQPEGNHFLAILRTSLELGCKINYCLLNDCWGAKNSESRKCFQYNASTVVASLRTPEGREKIIFFKKVLPLQRCLTASCRNHR